MMEKSFAPMYLLQVDAFSNACIWPWPFHKASESEPRAAENNSWEGWIIGVVGEGSDSQVWVSCVNLQLVDVTKKTKSDFQWLFTILKCWFIDSSILVCQLQWVQTFKVLQMQQMCWQKIIEKYCWIYLQGKWKLGKVPDFNRKYSKKHRSICKLQAQISYELPYICPKSNTHSWCFDIFDWIWWYQYQKKTSANETMHCMGKNHKNVMLLLWMLRSSSMFQNGYFLLWPAQGLSTSSIHLTHFWKTNIP